MCNDSFKSIFNLNSLYILCLRVLSHIVLEELFFKFDMVIGY